MQDQRKAPDWTIFLSFWAIECLRPWATLAEIGMSPADPSDAAQVIASLHGAIAKSRAMLAAVSLDDIIGETEPVNIPGTYREYANWRRKLGLPIEEIFSDARWLQTMEIMRAAGRSGRSSPG